MYKATVIKAPGQINPVSRPNNFDGCQIFHNQYTVFLAGSIEMGKAEDWQTKVTKDLETYYIRILNPRRDDWDSSWKQEATDPKFYEQVNWEQTAIQMSNLIAVYFAPDTVSPITLLELGTLLGSFPAKLVVYCPTGYSRKGNVDITCARFGVAVHTSYDTWLMAIKTKLSLI